MFVFLVARLNTNPTIQNIQGSTHIGTPIFGNIHIHVCICVPVGVMRVSVCEYEGRDTVHVCMSVCLCV